MDQKTNQQAIDKASKTLMAAIELFDMANKNELLSDEILTDYNICLGKLIGQQAEKGFTDHVINQAWLMYRSLEIDLHRAGIKERVEEIYAKVAGKHGGWVNGKYGIPYEQTEIYQTVKAWLAREPKVFDHAAELWTDEGWKIWKSGELKAPWGGCHNDGCSNPILPALVKDRGTGLDKWVSNFETCGQCHYKANQAKEVTIREDLFGFRYNTRSAGVTRKPIKSTKLNEPRFDTASVATRVSGPRWSTRDLVGKKHKAGSASKRHVGKTGGKGRIKAEEAEDGGKKREKASKKAAKRGEGK